MKPLRFLMTVTTACCASVGFANAQPAPTPPNGPPPAAGAPFYDLQQLPSTKGTVSRYTLTPRGDVDGLILADGTEVHFPPHLSTQLVYAIKPGDATITEPKRCSWPPAS
jgi:hypothetical protein